MPDETRDSGPGKPGGAIGGQAPSEEELAGRLNSLDQRLGRRKSEQAAATAPKPANTGFGAALRLSSDFIAAVVVGAVLGWGIDRFFGVAPWGMIILLILGFCAGILNVLRAAGRMTDPHARPAPTGRREMYDDEDE